MKILDIKERLNKSSSVVNPGRRLFNYLKSDVFVRRRNPMQLGDCVRGSSLYYICPREEILANKYDFIREEHLPQGLTITFNIGDKFHDLYRENFFGPMQEWVGAWECLKCGWDTDKEGLSVPAEYTGRMVASGRLAKMPYNCGGCGAPFICMNPDDENFVNYGKFKEWLVVDKTLLVNGHMDGWSIPMGGKRRLVDLKSESSNSFPNRSSAKEEHVYQVTIYQHLTGDRDGSVWYLDKSPWGDSPSFLKDFDISFDKHFFKKNIAKKIELIQNGLAGGCTPDRICISSDFPRAKECQLRDVCFG